MLTSTTPYNQPLGNNLTLKSIRDMQDLERLATFNQQIFGEPVGDMTRQFAIRHPLTRPEYWLFIQDDTTQQIVSTLVLLPWEWRYEDVTLKSGEMGIVATSEAYRNRGLIRALAARHKALLQEDDFDLSHIQGIPYFYRQFGYEYALPLEAGWHLELHNVPGVSPDELAHYQLRPAAVDDIPILMRLYDEAASTLDITTIRDAAIWRYLIEDTVGTEGEGMFWLLLDNAAQPVGYFRIVYQGFGKGLIVSETSRLNHSAINVVLHHIKQLATERNKPSIRFNLPVSNDLLSAARYWGAYDSGTYSWQILVVNVATLLRKLTPVLERRIAASPFNGLTQNVCINLYREAFDLHFEHGKLRAVNALGFHDGGAIRIPPNLFTPLVLGYRSRAELAQWYPDVAVWGQAQQLVDVLFPKLNGFIFTAY